MASRCVSVDISSEERIVTGIFADQVRVGGFIGRNIERVSAPAFAEAVVDIVRRAGVSVGAESLHKIGVTCDVVEPVESRGAALIVAVLYETFRARLLIGAEGL